MSSLSKSRSFSHTLSLNVQRSLTVTSIIPYSFDIKLILLGAQCGAAFLDNFFKTWLRDVLGIEDYVKLDPLNGRDRLSVYAIESGPMRSLIRQFIAKKHQFGEHTSEIRLDLPEPLNKLDTKDGRVKGGGLVIHR